MIFAMYKMSQGRNVDSRNVDNRNVDYYIQRSKRRLLHTEVDTSIGRNVDSTIRRLVETSIGTKRRLVHTEVDTSIVQNLT